MGSKTTTEQTQKQQSSTAPWAPAQPLLTGLLGKLGGIGTDVTPGQSAGAAALTQGAAGIPQLGPQAANVAAGLLGSGTNPAYSGMLGDTLASLRGTLNPFASGANTGPGGNPALRGYLDVARDDAANYVNSLFEGAGRFGSGGHAQALGRGIAQAEAPILADQYRADVGNQFDAAKTLYGAGNTTVSGLQGLDQTSIQNQLQGLGAAGVLPGIYTAPGTAQLGAANTVFGLPYSNIMQAIQAGIPIASLGSESSGTMTGTTTQNTPAINNIIAGLTAAATIGAKAYSMSDERVKEDIHPVGMLFDATPVYSFRYRGDPSERTHVGLMAQDVERDRPEAVAEFGGVKHVDYERATDRAAVLGMLAGVI